MPCRRSAVAAARLIWPAIHDGPVRYRCRPMPGEPDHLDLDEVRREVESHEWYHTIELAPGLSTPGWFDTAEALSRLPFPARLDGKRALDIGTFDGFWAFTMEQRGADEVIGIDILDPERWDWPAHSEQQVVEAVGARKAAGRGFELVHRVLGSKVQRLDLSVYDLDPAVHGEFDFVYVGSVLLHLRDPVRALEAVRAVCKPNGRALMVDAIDLELSLLSPRTPAATLDGIGRPWWWKPNVAGLERMARAAGFEPVEPPRRLYLKPGAGQPTQSPSARQLLTRAGREAFVTHRRGDPHAAVLVRPA